MGATAAILSIASTGLAYQGSQRQASAALSEGRYARSVDEQNAQLAEQQAQDAIDRGRIDENRQRLATRQNAGATRAAFGAQGLDASSGSAADVQASQAALGELDALTIRNNAAREAWGYRVEAVQQRKAGELAELSGKNAAAGYRTQGYSTLLTGASNLYGLGSSLNRSNSTEKVDLRGRPYRSGRY